MDKAPGQGEAGSSRRRKWAAVIALLAAGSVIGAAGFLAGNYAVHYTGSVDFCVSCHEMRVVAEQGWMQSSHYRNDAGVVASCTDCHVPPESEYLTMLWVKARDGTKDVYVHFLGESDPERMDWEHLTESAREKIHESSCVKCHGNLTARGFPEKTLSAHREYERLAGTAEHESCFDCHEEEIHPGFKRHLFGTGYLASKGGE